MVSAGSRLISDPVEARDVAVTALCMAAAAVADESLTHERKAARLMDCLGVLSATYPVGEAPGLEAFRRGLRQPLGRLLPPNVEAGPLAGLTLIDEMDMLADDAVDVAREHFLPSGALEQHWSWSRIRAEQEERALYRALRDLGEAGYSRARALLVDHPSGDVRTLRRLWDDLWPRIGDYQPVAAMPSVSVDGWWFACPQCRWPMRVAEIEPLLWDVRCEAHAENAVVYTTRTTEWTNGRPVLRPSRRPAASRVEPQPASSDHMAVSRAVWRFVTLPGVLECWLRDEATKAGAAVTMWPHLDAYDLHIEVGEDVWRVDAKVWASPVALVEALRRLDPPQELLHVVIPDHQHPVREVINDAVSSRRLTVVTARELITAVKRATRRAS